MKKYLFVVVSILVIASTQIYAQNDVLVDIQKIYPEELEVGGFNLDQDQDVQIEAVGLFRKGRRNDFILGNAWILNSGTREIAWELKNSDTEFRDDSDVQVFNGSVELPKGNYEVYYSSFPAYRWDEDWGHSDYRHRNDWDDCDDCDYCDNCDDWDDFSFGDLMGKIFHGMSDRHWGDYDWRDYDHVSREFKIVVKGKGKIFDHDEIEKLRDDFRESAVISMPGSRDNRYEKQGFKLERPMELEIYAIGEARRDGNFDYGLILNTETLERVWQLSYRGSDHAGGARKNRMAKETISLPAGTYAAFLITDDSHSPRRWNAAPPYDPAFWGLTIHSKNSDMKKYVKKYDYESTEMKNVVIDFTGLRDNEFVSKGFTLKKPMDLRIYAIGEGTRGEMYDYGWIVDAKTHKRVWEMDYRETEHAGGGSKNRLFDDVIHFEKGNYTAYFVTDGSHSYRRWNTSPPYDQERWGLTILAANKNFNPKDVASYEEPEDDQAVLVRLTKVRDYDRERERFTLKKDSEVRIYAIGEGQSGRMYDYGWIEDAKTGDVVWEMRYRRTDHAGGARKNRMYDDVVSLKAGEYIVYYETDDSHSFKDWNAAPPYDPAGWGITVYLVEK